MTPSNSDRRASACPQARSGKVGWVLLWLLGIPLPVLLGIYALKGCS